MDNIDVKYLDKICLFKEYYLLKSRPKLNSIRLDNSSEEIGSKCIENIFRSKYLFNKKISTSNNK